MLWNGNECGKKLSNGNLKATIPHTDYNRSRTTGEYATFQLFELQDVHMELNLGLPGQKRHSTIRSLFSRAN
jgi:hypothetical protein